MTDEETKDPVDVHVGSRLKERRRLRGITQVELAKSIGMSFQQIQKYERGVNRIRVAVLYKLAEALDTPPCYFMEGLPGTSTSIESVEGGSELSQAFLSIKTPLGRQRLVEMAQMLSHSPL
jgi:transcriptional regulator with XRE-family HTH domain